MPILYAYTLMLTLCLYSMPILYAYSMPYSMPILYAHSVPILLCLLYALFYAYFLPIYSYAYSMPILYAHSLYAYSVDYKCYLAYSTWSHDTIASDNQVITPQGTDYHNPSYLD